MQKLFFFYLLICSLSTAAQKPVEGIWIFKVGQASIDVTNQVATELHTNVKLAKTTRNLFLGDEGAIFELERNTDGDMNRPFRAPYCADTRVFYINKYVVANVITLRNVYLTFRDGILIQLFSDQPEGFLPPFISVHGNGTPSSKVDSTTCSYEGKTETVLNVKYIDQWDSGEIKAASVHEYYYDTDCQKREESFFEVYAVKELTEAIICENQMRAKFSPSKQDAEKRRLKDLDF
ncbi:hypothetical protein [Draconibacterium mangrovi]|uniref:hypothetical protein n=1 Tax=Draconibacterium mangrovi TaxID=2697469 RepID=UPI0013D668FA|nr:hypothetical protein [Draconibacterium mangrovi]